MKAPFVVGDVIRSDDFVNGDRDSTGRLSVGYASFFNDTDLARAKKRYVVERVEFEGGGTAHGPGDVYPDGWHITARELTSDDEYDRMGTLISFYTSGSFRCKVDLARIEVVGKLLMTFIAGCVPKKEGE